MESDEWRTTGIGLLTEGVQRNVRELSLEGIQYWSVEVDQQRATATDGGKPAEGDQLGGRAWSAESHTTSNKLHGEKGDHWRPSTAVQQRVTSICPPAENYQWWATIEG